MLAERFAGVKELEPSQVKKNDRHSFVCLCVQDGPSADIHASTGPMLIIPPAALIETWVTEFEAGVDETDTRSTWRCTWAITPVGEAERWADVQRR